MALWRRDVFVVHLIAPAAREDPERKTITKHYARCYAQSCPRWLLTRDAVPLLMFSSAAIFFSMLMPCCSPCPSAFFVSVSSWQMLIIIRRDAPRAFDSSRFFADSDALSS